MIKSCESEVRSSSGASQLRIRSERSLQVLKFLEPPAHYNDAEGRRSTGTAVSSDPPVSMTTKWHYNASRALGIVARMVVAPPPSCQEHNADIVNVELPPSLVRCIQFIGNSDSMPAPDLLARAVAILRASESAAAGSQPEVNRY